jgi:hypothetical protein
VSIAHCIIAKPHSCVGAGYKEPSSERGEVPERPQSVSRRIELGDDFRPVAV